MAEAIPTNLSDEDQTKMCDPCSFRDVTALAGTYCQVCLEFLCNTCEEYHRSSKASRDHELKTLEEWQRLLIKQNELISSIMACDAHRIETLTQFCIDHNVPICSSCTTAEHRECNTTTFKQITKEAKTKKYVSLYMEKSNELLSKIKEFKDLREKDKHLLQNSTRKCIQEVKKIKLQIITWVEKLGKDMEDKIANKETELLAEMEGDIKSVDEISKHVQDIVKSFEILGQDFEVATSVLTMKEKINIEAGCASVGDLDDSRDSVTLEFEPSLRAIALMSDITSIGKLTTDNADEYLSSSDHVDLQFCLQDISSVKNKKNIKARTNFITGCTFMPDGKLVICDQYNNSVKLFTSGLKLENELMNEHAFDVAVVSFTKVIVSEPLTHSVQFLNISGNIEKGKNIPVGMRCVGIDCKNEKLYISCHKIDGTGGLVKVLTMDGVTLNTFKIRNKYPRYLAVNRYGDRILVSSSDNGVLCSDNTGNTLCNYHDEQLTGSLGLLFDSFDNFMVCGYYTNTIHVVKSDGTQIRILFTADDGLDDPSCLAYNPINNTLVIGQNDTPISRFGALKKRVFKSSCSLLAKTVVWKTNVRN